MFKKLFGGSKKSKEPGPENLALQAIRERLLPLSFEETSDPKYVDNVFRRGNFLFRWGFNYKDERYFFYLSEQNGKNESIEGLGMWNKNEKDWNEFKDKIIKTLDYWLNV